jgi:hypothetical protein
LKNRESPRKNKGEGGEKARNLRIEAFYEDNKQTKLTVDESFFTAEGDQVNKKVCHSQ